MKTCIIVGGGVCGLTASILLSEHFDRVVLVEQSESVGGLLGSVCDELGNYYDQGTHIPVTTGIAEVDNILFDIPDINDNWHRFKKLETGNFFVDSWDLETQTIDARKLEEAQYHKGIGEFLSLSNDCSEMNIEDYLKQTLGPTFYKHLAKPVLEKLYGKDIDKDRLSRDTSINYFGANRIKAFDESLTRVLKQHLEIDKKLGFHTSAEYEHQLEAAGVETPTYYYPKVGGAQNWIDALTTKAINVGVEIIYKTQITKITAHEHTIKAVELHDGSRIECDLVFWSAPPVFALKAGGLQVASYKPTFRTAYILHATFDQTLLNSRSHYLWNWDPSSDIFRITLYDNLRKGLSHSVSAEVLRDKKEQAYTLSQGVEDLKRMQLVASDAKLVSGFVQQINNTFPVPTFEFNDATHMNYKTLTGAYCNILVSGRFSGRCWLLHDVLKLAYQDISAYCRCE